MQDKEQKYIEAFGRRCRTFRQERDWTLEDMLVFGFSSQHYQKIEKGKKGLTLWTAKRIAEAFQVSLSELLKDL